MPPLRTAFQQVVACRRQFDSFKTFNNQERLWLGKLFPVALELIASLLMALLP
jgi:hypothetical protein